jgi:hypothetical protein
MIYFLIIALLFISMILVFVKSCRSVEKFQWSNLTLKQHISLSLAFASLIQFLFISLFPGWIVATYIVGYNDIYTTPLESIFFTVITLLSNTLIYYFIFYFLIGLISKSLAIKTGDRNTK